MTKPTGCEKGLGDKLRLPITEAKKNDPEFWKALTAAYKLKEITKLRDARNYAQEDDWLNDRMEGWEIKRDE